MKLGSTTRKKARLEIIPLIDIMFFLVATFMMVSLSMIKNQGIDVRLPVAYSGEAQEIPDSLTLSVTRDNILYCNKQEVSLDEMKVRVTEFTTAYPNGVILLNGDEEAQVGTLLSVLDTLRLMGVTNVFFPTRKE